MMEADSGTTAGSKRGPGKDADQKKIERKVKKRKYWGKSRGTKKERGERRAMYTEASQGNQLFERYYRELGLVPEEEWDAFLAQLKEELPATFRITGCRSSAASLLRVLEERYFQEMQEIEVEGERMPRPKPLPWYPDRLAWHIPLTRRYIRKSPLLEQFHCFLVNETELGNTSRQEAVSMIPPLLLDVKPHHKVLDMCAAPGSKTSQLIELLHAEDSEDNPVPSGVVVANDADNRRCYMLVHQAKRLNSPCVMVTNHDASIMPNMYYHTDSGEKVQLSYDRVLCDVPCSGDGTLRKNLTIWRSWSPAQPLGLHKIQLRILLRGLELLNVGGRLVYSTCSLNPVEDEAVIAAAVTHCKGAVELVDVSNCLPQLKRSKGVSSWKVMTKAGDWASSLDAVPSKGQPKVASTVFPPSEPEAMALHLERCIRILPHQQDTGGFFVALLAKVAVLPWQKKVAKEGRRVAEVTACMITEEGKGEEEATIDPIDNSVEQEEEEEGEAAIHKSVEEVEGGEGKEKAVTVDMSMEEDKEQAASSLESLKVTQQDVPHTRYSKRWRLGFKEDPFVFMREEDATWQKIKDYYGFNEDFPCQQMLTRSEMGKKRNLYFVSRLVRELTIMNERTVKVEAKGVTTQDCLNSAARLFHADIVCPSFQIINIGTKAFARCSHKGTNCEFRPVQEGIVAMLPYMSKQVANISRDDLVIFLKEGNPLFTSLSLPTASKFGELEMGPCVVVYDPRLHHDSALLDRVALSTWRAAKSARLFVAVRERTHLLTVLGEEIPEGLTASVEKAATPGVEGEGKDKGGEGEGIEEEAEEDSKGEGLGEGRQRPGDGPLESDPIESGIPTAVDQPSGEDKDVETTEKTDLEQ